MTGCTGMAADSEFNMGEGKVLKKAKRHILLSTFSAINNDIHWCDQALVSVGIVDGKGGHTSWSGKRPATAGLFFDVGDDRSTTNILNYGAQPVSPANYGKTDGRG